MADDESTATEKHPLNPVKDVDVMTKESEEMSVGVERKSKRKIVTLPISGKV